MSAVQRELARRVGLGQLFRSRPQEDVPMPPGMLEGCRQASLLIDGPRLRSLGITSSIRGEGRTSVAITMARVQREDYGRRVVLVDLDFENPTLARRLPNCRIYPGLAELARGDTTLDDALQPVDDGVSMVPTGASDESVARLVTEIGRKSVLEAIAGEADVLIADLPPLLDSVVGRATAAAFANLLFVVRAGVTPVNRIREATRDLHVDPPVLLNGVSTSLPPWLRQLTAR